MIRILISLFAASLFLAAPAQAQWGNSFSPGEARKDQQEGKIVPLNKVYRALKKQYGGYQLETELFSKPNGNGSEYHIDWLTEDGRKMRFVVDAQTGKVTSREGG